VRPYPYDEEPLEGLRREDVDGDGRVLSMRIRDPNGPWKACEQDARLLIRRAPDEIGGTYFRLLPEGRLDRYDGSIIKLQPRKEGLDLNRNFPAAWRQEHEQHGAGPFPVFDDWMYEHQGVFAWTVEIWSPQRQAGIADYKFIEWYREHPVEDDLKLLKWNDDVLGGRGFVDWYAFEHPQLGAVELGGWDTLYTWSNPPHAQLEQEIARFPAWLLWQLSISPRLELFNAVATRLADDAWRVRCVVHNTGWLPSYVTKRALDHKLTRGVLCEIELPAGATLETGLPRVELGQLEGRAYKPATPSSWAGWSGDVTDDRAQAEWVIRAPQGSVVRLRAWHDRAGEARVEVRLD
jgi:hypothetical protein